MPWTNVRQGVQMLSEQVQQIIDALKGTPGRGQRFSLTNYSSPAEYAVTIQNLGENGKALKINKSTGEPVLEVNNAGVTFSTEPLISTTTLKLANGTAAAPSLTFSSDTDTGLFHSPTATDNTLRVTANGTEQLAIGPSAITARNNALVVDTSTTRVGIGTASPGKALDITGEARTSSTLTVTSGGLVVGAGGASITGETTLTGHTTVSSGSNLTLAGGALTLTGDVTTSAGRVVLPSDTTNGHIDPELTFTGSTGTGLYSGAAETLSVTTNQVKRATFGDTGTLTLETATSGHSLSVLGTTDLTGKLTLGSAGLESTSGPLTLGSGKLTLTSGDAQLTGGRLLLKQDTSGTNAQTPELAFYSADGTTLTTGLYSGADNTLTVATGGAARLAVSDTGAAVTGSLSTTAGVELGTASGVLKLPNGAANAPALTFSSDTDLGLYRSGENALVFTTGASDTRLKLTDAGVSVNGELYPTSQFSVRSGSSYFEGNVFVAGSSGTPAVDHALGLNDGTAAKPTLTFIGNSNTGLYRAGENTLGVTTGGSQRMVIDGAGNVGVGTASPTARLDVNGTLTTNNTLTAQSLAIGSTGHGFSSTGAASALSLNLNNGNLTNGGTISATALNGGSLSATTGTFSGVLQGPNGAVGSPAYSFTNGPTSGLYLATATDGDERLGLSTDGVQRVLVTKDGTTLANTLTVTTGGATINGAVSGITTLGTSDKLTVGGNGADITGDVKSTTKFLTPTGTAPSYSFTDAATSGLWRETGGDVKLAREGTTRLALTGTGLDLTGATTVVGAFSVTGAGNTATFGDQVRGPAGTVSAPALSFSADPDTGLYRSAANTVSVAVGGVQGLTVDATQNVIPGGSTAYDRSTSTGQYLYVAGGSSTPTNAPAVSLETEAKYPLFYNTTNDQLYLFRNSVWRAPAAGVAGSLDSGSGNATIDAGENIVLNAKDTNNDNVAQVHFQTSGTTKLTVPYFDPTDVNGSSVIKVGGVLDFRKSVEVPGTNPATGFNRLLYLETSSPATTGFYRQNENGDVTQLVEASGGGTTGTVLSDAGFVSTPTLGATPDTAGRLTILPKTNATPANRVPAMLYVGNWSGNGLTVTPTIDGGGEVRATSLYLGDTTTNPTAAQAAGNATLTGTLTAGSLATSGNGALNLGLGSITAGGDSVFGTASSAATLKLQAKTTAATAPALLYVGNWANPTNLPTGGGEIRTNSLYVAAANTSPAAALPAGTLITATETASPVITNITSGDVRVGRGLTVGSSSVVSTTTATADGEVRASLINLGSATSAAAGGLSATGTLATTGAVTADTSMRVGTSAGELNILSKNTTHPSHFAIQSRDGSFLHAGQSPKNIWPLAIRISGGYFFIRNYGSGNSDDFYVVLYIVPTTASGTPSGAVVFQKTAVWNFNYDGAVASPNTTTNTVRFYFSTTTGYWSLINNWQSPFNLNMSVTFMGHTTYTILAPPA